ncbi:PKD domain-containing protein, partial [Flavobacterium polysaccharolyticum]
IKYTPQVLNANVVANFSLETAASNLTYDWTFYNLDNTTVLAKVSTANATQSFSTAGRYRVVLNVKDEKGCITTLESYTSVLPACTPITGVIKISSSNTSGNSISTLFQFSSPGSTSSLACNETSFPVKLYTVDKLLQVGTRLFLDQNLILSAGNGKIWYKNAADGISYRVDTNGVITEIFNCSSTDPSASLGYEYIISPGVGFSQHYVKFISMDGFESAVSLSSNDGNATICAKSIIEDNGEGATLQTGNRCN